MKLHIFIPYIKKYARQVIKIDIVNTGLDKYDRGWRTLYIT